MYILLNISAVSKVGNKILSVPQNPSIYKVRQVFSVFLLAIQVSELSIVNQEKTSWCTEVQNDCKIDSEID